MAQLKFFRHGQRVVITDHGSHPELNGRKGVVTRVCTTGQAWVNVSGGLPDHLRAFSADDEHGRANHTKLYPDECSKSK